MNKLRANILTVILLLSLVTEVRAEISMEQYLKLKNTPEFDVYLRGYLDGVGWANGWLKSENRPALYCVPGMLALNVSNLKQIVEDHVERNKSMYQTPNERDFGATALLALTVTFPCK